MIFDDKNCCSARAEFKKREMYTRYMRSAYLILNDLRVFWIKITKTFYKKQNKSVDELAVNEWMYQKLVSHLDVFIHDSCARRRMWSNNNTKKNDCEQGISYSCETFRPRFVVFLIFFYSNALISDLSSSAYADEFSSINIPPQPPKRP